MLSTMETTDESLRSADRAAATPFVQTPRISVWYPPGIAAYFTVIAGASLLMRNGQLALGAGLLLLAIVAVVAQALITRARWGTWPRMAIAPSEIKRAFALYIVLAVAAILVSTVIWSWFGDIAALVSIFCTMLTVVWAYEFRLHPAAAARVRRRLA